MAQNPETIRTPDISQVLTERSTACAESLVRLSSEECTSDDHRHCIAGLTLAYRRLGAWYEAVSHFQEEGQAELLAKESLCAKQRLLKLAPDRTTDQNGLSSLETNSWQQWAGHVSVANATASGKSSCTTFIYYPRQFRSAIRDFHSFINELYDLMLGNELEDRTMDAYYKTVVACNTVSTLLAMRSAAAAFLLADTKSAEPIDEALFQLLQLKAVRLAADDYINRNQVDYWNCNDIAAEDVDHDGRFKSEMGPLNLPGLVEQYSMHSLRAKNGEEVLSRATWILNDNEAIWVDWKRMAKGFIRNAANDCQSSFQARVLAQLLHCPKPADILLPECIGCVEDIKFVRQAPDLGGRLFGIEGRYGYMYELPSIRGLNTSVRSLHCAIKEDDDTPTAAQRVRLCLKLARAIQGMHAVDWRHYDVHGGNVLLLSDGIDKPILTGCDYLRDPRGDHTTGNAESSADIYRYPAAQADPPYFEHSRKVYDIYSLGHLFLEIAHWKRLPEILGMSHEMAMCNRSSIRARLTDNDNPRFQSSALNNRHDIPQEQFWNVVRRCLHAYGPDGLGIDQKADERDPDEKLKLHKAFDEDVIKQLQEVMVELE